EQSIMPIDYQQIYTRIKEIGAGARERKKTLEERRTLARNLFTSLASDLDGLRKKVDSAKQADSNIRCAVPLSETLASSHPTPDSTPQATLIAADGSQINPDRHASVQFGLVNVGAIIMRMDSGEAPVISTETELMYGDDLMPNGIPMSEGMVALKRDLAERMKLDEVSQGIKGRVVTFTDGPIELWGAQGEDSKSFHDFLEKYKTTLSRLQSRNVITAGYVDKPSADLVVRLLEIAHADAEQTQKIREFHPLRGVSDRWLFGERENPLLPPGHRSAVFKIQSSSEKNYKGVLEVHFFYLNVGTEGHPWPVRVEIPRWVVDDKDQLNLLHAMLVDQCNIMGSRPYPYLLHRAHETAVVKNEEKYQIEQMLQQELRRNNEDVDEGSNKQSAKDRGGRTRYG
ncbi:MAG: DNA double-strand break repair nuclease NurA, partial [Anaerolineales bacterium]|nr:DNA double-strand break repair nuclease NurA [Anaerolineales bacterium]